VKQLMAGHSTVLRRCRFYELAEVFFGGDVEASGADVIEFLQHPRPVGGAPFQEAWTLLVELTPPPAQLRAAMNKTTRYEIKRAEERDGLHYSSWDASSRALPLDAFLRFFNRFAASKGLDRAPAQRLRAMARAGVLDLSCATDGDGTVLVWHAHLRAPGRVRLLHSTSLFREQQNSADRSRIGRANRWHHWRDMLRFRDEGFSTFDLGGWYAGEDDAELLRINQYKQAFGGRLVKEYNFSIAGSTRGRLVLLARRALRRRGRALTVSGAASAR
jgi:hypothetical protein